MQTKAFFRSGAVLPREHNSLFGISLATAELLLATECAELAFYLLGSGGNGPVLYSDTNTRLSREDLQRLKDSGVSHLFARTCDSYSFETHIDIVLSNSAIPADEKVKLVFGVGTSIARDLVSCRGGTNEIDRSAKLLDSVIRSVLLDPEITVNMLKMVNHERSMASHMFVVSALCVVFGAELFGADMGMLRTLGMAGMMHDLGKLTIDPKILDKRETLNSAETQLVHQHPIESVRLLADDPHITPAVRQAILQHHEWIDGRGYPLGLRGDEISAVSRMLTIVDSFHVMIGQRTDRTALTPKEVGLAMKLCSEHQFDAKALGVWDSIIQEHAHELEIAWKEDSDNGGTLSSRNEHCAARRARSSHGPRQTRFQCEPTISVKCVYAGRLDDATCAPDEFFATLFDISRGGMCFFSSYPMYRGEVVHIMILEDSTTKWIRSSVAWCKQYEETNYKVGLNFEQRITEREARSSASVARLHSDVEVIDAYGSTIAI